MSLLKSFPVATAMVAFVCGSAQAETFSSKEGRFRVSIPATPTMTKSSAQAGAQSMVLNTYAAAVKGGSFAIVYSDLPAGVPPTDRIDNILDGAASGIVSNTKGTLLKSDKTEAAGYPARDVLWSVQTTNGEVLGRARLILVGERMYQVLAVGAKAFVESQPVLDFFTSFKFDNVVAMRPSAKPKARKSAVTKPMPGPSTTKIDTPAAWHAFRTNNNEGGYTVQVPSKPERGQAAGILGVKNCTMFNCSAEGLSFTIMGQPVRETALKAGPRAVLKASRDGLALSHEGKVKTSKSLQIGDFPACEFRVTSNSSSSNVILARSVLAGRRLYTVYVTGSETALAGPSARKFLDSFDPTQ